MQLITKYLPADYTDSFQKTISSESSIQVNDLFKLMFIEYPKWGLWLLKVRDLIVKPLGLKTNKTFIDLIIEENNEGNDFGSTGFPVDTNDVCTDVGKDAMVQ